MSEGSFGNALASHLDMSDETQSSELGTAPNIEMEGYASGTYESILRSDPNYLLNLALQEIEKNPSCHPAYAKYDKAWFEQVDENTRLFDFKLEELEMQLYSLDLDETIEVDPCRKEENIKSLRKKIANAENSTHQTKQGKSTKLKKKATEEFTDHHNKKGNKLDNKKSPSRMTSNGFSRRNFSEAKPPEKDPEHSNKNLLSNSKSELDEIDKPAENITICMEHFEFLHKKLQWDIMDLVEREDFAKIALDLENDPKINNIVPSFLEYLRNETENKIFCCPLQCLVIILAILKNPYRKFEYLYKPELPVVKEQTDIAEYLLNCLQNLNILRDDIISEKLAEAVVVFANIHATLCALIQTGFKDILEAELDEEHEFWIYPQVLNIMISIGARFLFSLLPKFFERLSSVADEDPNCELYFQLLRACEVLFTDAIEYESLMEKQKDEKKLHSFLFVCYSYFGNALMTRLMPVFRKYENRKNREEQFFSKKHALVPTKHGYMDLKMEFLFKKNKKREDSESINSPSEKQSTFNSKCLNDKILKYFSNRQSGYRVDTDTKLLPEKEEYLKSIEIPLSYLRGLLLDTS